MSDIFDTGISFEELGLRDSVLKGVRTAGFEHPTHIQAQLIPLMLSGRDVIGQAKTGTGKTAAFGLPIFHTAEKDVPMQALILVPTRELAAQVTAELSQLGQFTPIRTSCIIGGESMRQQIQSVKHGGHILVGTPGRVMDMRSRNLIYFNKLRAVVLDEVDRMLDIGFRDDIRKILSSIKQDHQTVLVSATISGEIERLSRRFAKRDTARITTTAGALTVSLVDQKLFFVEPWDKQQLLLHLLRHERPDTTVVFCRTKATVRRLTRYLRDQRISAREIHGDLEQNRRNRVMASMREGKLAVLIASDLAARGLDIEHISHVINYDLPDDPELYVHRIGRTARVGRRGVAWSFATSSDGRVLTEIEKLTGVLIEQMHYPDFKPGPIPQDIAQDREMAASKPTDPNEAMRLRAMPKPAESLAEDELSLKFPGGKIPKSLPRRTLGSRLRGRSRR